MPDIFDLLTIFDWISPVAAGIQDVVNGPSHTFLIPEASGYSGREIDQILREHGVKTWGMMIVNHTLMITVKEGQARWADYLLQRAAVPLNNPIANGIEPEDEFMAWGWDEQV